MEKSACGEKWGSGSAFVGIIILGLGIVFLLANWGIIPSMHRTWPLILIIVGLAFLFGGHRKGRRSAKGGDESSSSATPGSAPPGEEPRT